MFLKLFAISLPILVLLDLIWLGFFAKGFYAKNIGFLMKGDINWYAAGAFYLLFIAGIVVFVLLPSIDRGELREVVLKGALFGLICYATYDLTNLATVKDWPVIVTLVDLIWGAVLSSLVSVIAYSIYTKLFV